MEDNKKELKAILETLPKKDGGTYKCVVINLTDTCQKKVFLEPAELELLELTLQKNDKNKTKMPF